jgi:hypothetical protein
MTTEGSQTFRDKELVIVFFFSFVLCMFLLFVVERAGYDLFYEQVGAGLVLYLSLLVTTTSIARKGIKIDRFLLLLLLFSPGFLFYSAYTKMDHEPLVIDNFETGTGGWYSEGLHSAGVNSTIFEEVRLSPEGSWHMVWKVENCCGDPRWAVIENCPAVTFRLQDYDRIELWYKTEKEQFSFDLQLREEYPKMYLTYLGASSKWVPLSLELPRNNNDTGDFRIANATELPDPTSPFHISFSNDCNETYHIDYIRLTSKTFLDQNPVLVGAVEVLLFGGVIGLVMRRKLMDHSPIKAVRRLLARALKG